MGAVVRPNPDEDGGVVAAEERGECGKQIVFAHDSAVSLSPPVSKATPQNAQGTAQSFVDAGCLRSGGLCFFGTIRSASRSL